ncbi:hypothetical protein [Streptomyces sp. NPDC059575]|uniref:hypothetical protein n=1 Tax=Streptomyces sp. NPDC059575 TaxID=3346872 RepID=UPI0036775441
MKQWREDAQPEWPDVASATPEPPVAEGNRTQAFPESGTVAETGTLRQGSTGTSRGGWPVVRGGALTRGGGGAQSGIRTGTPTGTVSVTGSAIPRGGQAAPTDADETAVVPRPRNARAATDFRRTTGPDAERTAVLPTAPDTDRTTVLPKAPGAEDRTTVLPNAAASPASAASAAERTAVLPQPTGTPRPTGRTGGAAGSGWPVVRDTARPIAPRDPWDARAAATPTAPEATGTGTAATNGSTTGNAADPAHDPHEVTVQLDSVKGEAEARPDGPVFVDESGRRGRTVRRIGLAVAVACAGYAVVIVATLLSGSSDAPWLPVPDKEDKPAGRVHTSPVPTVSTAPTAADSGGGTGPAEPLPTAASAVPGASGAPSVPAAGTSGPPASPSASPTVRTSTTPGASESPAKPTPTSSPTTVPSPPASTPAGSPTPTTSGSPAGGGGPEPHGPAAPAQALGPRHAGTVL